MSEQVKVLSTNESGKWLADSRTVNILINDGNLSPGDMVVLVSIYARFCNIEPDPGIIDQYVSQYRLGGK